MGETPCPAGARAPRQPWIQTKSRPARRRPPHPSGTWASFRTHPAGRRQAAFRRRIGMGGTSSAMWSPIEAVNVTGGHQ
jgi:hypothetical protein